jgi:hypothetical protein
MRTSIDSSRYFLSVAIAAKMRSGVAGASNRTAVLPSPFLSEAVDAIASFRALKTPVASIKGR